MQGPGLCPNPSAKGLAFRNLVESKWILKASP